MGMTLGWWLSVPLLLVALVIVFDDGVAEMVREWGTDEYSYAYLIPPLTLWLLWQQRADIVAAGGHGSWIGAALVLFGLVLALFGELSTIYAVIQYAFLLTLFGLALAFVGWRGLRVVWPTLLYLVFMVPLPDFLYRGLSAELQILSSQLGVAVIRALGIAVYLEGNVIDLGTYKLQVVEACSGLRYLFPLLSFGYLCTLLYNGPRWHKLVLLAATVPITIAVNSIRIGITGALVEYGGSGMAEGFLHFFEGWIIFLAALTLLFALMWGLARLSGHPGGIGGMMRLDLLTATSQRGALGLDGRPPPAFIAAVTFAAIAAVAALLLPARTEIVPERKTFGQFPTTIDGWRGRPLTLDRMFIEALKFDDYALVDYYRADDPNPVNLYVAYYGSQRKGASVHSPRSCIPGGGWEISSLEQITIEGAGPDGQALAVNRAVIAKGIDKQLVYYWFDQRGRQMTSEYDVKLMLFWDALTRSRTDGALVRLVTPIRPGDPSDRADQRLGAFIRAVYPEVAAFVPR